MEHDAISISLPRLYRGSFSWHPNSGSLGNGPVPPGSVLWPPGLDFKARIVGKHSGSVLRVAITVDGKPVLSRSHQGAGAFRLTSQVIRKAIKSAHTHGDFAFEIRVDEAKAGR